MADRKNVYAVLLAGGTGTRLWPVSRELYPKQLVKFIGNDSLVQSTIKRLNPVIDTDNVRIVCGDKHFHEIARHVEMLGIPSAGKIITEPCGRNTAPAILLAVLNIVKTSPDAVLCIFPADHVIRDIALFHQKIEAAIDLANQGHIVTFGIQPNYPETGYGYIEGDKALPRNALTIKRFLEKPDKETAQKFIEAGNFFWNSGMFAFKASVLMDEIRIHLPTLLDKMQQNLSDKPDMSLEEYQNLPNISIDYAVMEKTKKGAVLPSDFGWSDIGSWKSLYDFLPKDASGNVIDGDVVVQNTQNCFIFGYERLIAANRLKDMVIVETPDAVFVSDIDNSRDVKNIVDTIKEEGREEHHHHRTVHHPWGSATLLEKSEHYQVSRLIVYPGLSFETSGAINLSVVSGAAAMPDGKLLQKGMSLTLSETTIIRNEGSDPLYLIEVGIK